MCTVLDSDCDCDCDPGADTDRYSVVLKNPFLFGKGFQVNNIEYRIREACGWLPIPEYCSGRGGTGAFQALGHLNCTES